MEKDLQSLLWRAVEDAQADPPGIRKATITKELRAEFRRILQCAQNLGFAAVRLQGSRVAGSSSAKPGKIVDIKRGRKP